jgi:hypothetical protein
VVNPEETPTVQQVFMLSRKHSKNGTRAIATQLNAAGVKPRTGERFYPSSIDRILSNEQLYKKYGVI